ncbi:hypothetical protein CkaCkLH20_12830 [Colletotrichum karsti]|uniref:Ubiquitin-like protease family profile domain-containing protein n=1 Tax=Colletotrichum karsti TaxID=1095194 RepID=A0A9P6HSH7_9PEZI|nr:uncharacterized protein CkaCkLH20_12830 [Colletotrichum karsti]KAF9869643.1 hypothetical protein CkaCkLH20_12830 [Colletotrichum karsti]
MGSSSPAFAHHAPSQAGASSSPTNIRPLYLHPGSTHQAESDTSEQSQKPRIIHYDHSNRSFRAEGSIVSERPDHAEKMVEEKTKIEIIDVEGYRPHSDDSTPSPSPNVKAKDAKKRKLRDFLERTPTSKAFAHYEAKQLQDCHRRTLKSEAEVETSADAYPRRPFSGTDFNLPGATQESATQESHVAPSPIELHAAEVDIQLGDLTEIAARIAVASQHIRESHEQLADAYDRKTEVELEMDELRIKIHRSWENIQARQADPRDHDAWEAAQASSDDSQSFANIEAKLRDLTRKKRLIEIEINDRETKRQKIEEAVAAFISPKGSVELENLEEVADAYVPPATGLNFQSDIDIFNEPQANDPVPDETSRVNADSQRNCDPSNPLYIHDDDLYLPSVGHIPANLGPGASICLDIDDFESPRADEAEELLKEDRLQQYRTAIRQLNDPHECLTGDTIDVLQKILKDDTEKTGISTAHTLLMHPLWLRVEALPANFPRAASTAHRILAVMHHEDPKHWTVGEINLLESTFKHYDSMNSELISIQVEERVLPWLNGMTGRDFTWHQVPSPRQLDGSSCGVHVLVTLGFLLDGKVPHDVAGADANRKVLLRLAANAFHLEFPGKAASLEEEEPDNVGPDTTVGSPYDLGYPKIPGNTEVILVESPCPSPLHESRSATHMQPEAPSTQSTVMEIDELENREEYGHDSGAAVTKGHELEIHELLSRQSYAISPSHRRRAYIEVADTD